MSQPLDLEIITPERVMLTAKITSISCPGAEGRFQVLHNHAPFLAELETGEITVVDEKGERSVYAVSGGVSQVFRNHVRVLADTAERADEIDVVRAEDAKRRAEERIRSRQADIDMDRAHAALLRAINRLKIARGS